ncbi:hypothetical protein NAT51_06900 [Flavobacterium amniphilum]|uniref:hypothetical protein n=1 Tax=Flavobacterium amniphilum TaxID=1834035 RepID=UPI002029F9DF|nr:hypothetical protein [Flavobacterium amniphilum]MCL9805241.1 hypothetical protein [Flavobacterium amniphilum]
MKKLFFLMAGLLALSCSDEDSAISDFNFNTKLYTITIKNERGNNSSEVGKMNFSKGKLRNIQYPDKAHDDYYYSNGLVSELYSYASDNRLLKKTIYTYDSKGRIIEISKTYFFINQTQNNTKYFFTYTGNKILIRTGTPGSSVLVEITADADNNIISEKFLDVNGNSHECTFTYTNGNLTSFTDNSLNDTPVTRKYTYTPLKNNSNYNQYLFGKEWKMNYCLDNWVTGNGFSGKMEAVSKNLPSGFTQDTNGERDYETSINYLFNEKNQLSKEMRNTTYADYSQARKDLNYEYR